MRLSESRETAPPLCGLEGRLDHILGQHPLGEFPPRVSKPVANGGPFDLDILQADAVPREKEDILNREVMSRGVQEEFRGAASQGRS
jgi:hypothetical protein